MKTFKIFPSDASTYTTNGLAVLTDVLEATENEKLNRMYSLELEVILDPGGKWKHLETGNIIVVDDQPFRIFQTQIGLDTMFVYARHRFWDLYDNEVLDVRPTGKNCLGAMTDVLGAMNYATPFTAYSDITATNTQYFIRRNGLDCFVGTDSILTRWDGELKLEGHLIKILANRGLDRGVHIRYRKNMESMEVIENEDNVITRLRPIGFDGFTLPEVYIDSPRIDDYPFPKIREVSFDVNPSDYPTITDAQNALRALGNAYMVQTGCDLPQVTINVDLVLLENTSAYEGLEHLVRVFLGDTVTAINERLGITHKMKVIEIEKDLLTGRNAKVVLGTPNRTAPSAFSKVANVLNDISQALQHTKGDLTKAIEDATNALNSAIGGYVLKKENELLIMDTTSTATATKVWRWNLNGLGYSNSGYAGPYGLAMTMNGAINASFITTGTLSASLVKTGILQSFDGDTWLNLDAGTFSFADGKISWDGTTFSVAITQDSIIYQGTTAPSSPTSGQIWIDISGAYPIFRRWDGNEWEILGPSTASDLGAYPQTEADLLADTVDALSAQMNDGSIVTSVINSEALAGLLSGYVTATQVGTIVETSLEGVQTSVYTLQKIVNGDPEDETDTGLSGDYQLIRTYMDFGETGLLLGKSNSPLKINISNSQMDFMDGGETVAYINGMVMYIKTARILTTLTVGVHEIKKHNSDITIVRWVGDST